MDVVGLSLLEEYCVRTT